MIKKILLIQLLITISLTTYTQNQSIWGLDYGETARNCLTFVKEDFGHTGTYSEKEATIKYYDCNFYGTEAQEVILYFDKNALTRAEVHIMPKEEFTADIYSKMKSLLTSQYNNPTEDITSVSNLDSLSTLWYINKKHISHTVQLAVEPVTSKIKNINIYFSAGKAEKKTFKIPDYQQEDTSAQIIYIEYQPSEIMKDQPFMLLGLQYGNNKEYVYDRIASIKNILPGASNDPNVLTYRNCYFAGERVEEIDLFFKNNLLTSATVKWQQEDRPTVIKTYKRLRDKLTAKHGIPATYRRSEGVQPYLEEEGYGIPEIEKKKEEMLNPDFLRTTWIIGDKNQIEINLNIEFHPVQDRYVTITYNKLKQ